MSLFVYFSNRRKHLRETIRSWKHSENLLCISRKYWFHQYEMWQTIWSITYFYWCLVYMYYSWYFGSAHVSLSGWWCMLHSGASHRCYTIPCLRGAPCVSVVCLWWQRQQCTSAWGRKTFFKYRLSCSTHFKVCYILCITLFMSAWHDLVKF